MNNNLLDYFKGDDLAADVWQSKYMAKGEETPDDMHKRLAKAFASIEKKYNKKKFFLKNPLSKYGKIRSKLTEEKIYNLFKDFKYIIPQGSIMSQLGTESIGSLSNCFVVGQPVDSYGGILQKDQELAQLMKRRGGVGIDISTLRPQSAPTTNAAKSSTGAMSFLERFSNTTREVAQNGRRGALMISADINHPDIMEFIKVKRDLTKVTGANISIKLNDEFMKAVENNEDYILRWPCNTDISKFSDDYIKSEYNKLHYIEDHDNNNEIIYTKTIKAREYWDEIIKSAHGVAEPGLMFWDNMVNYSPDGVYPQFRQVTTNPCSEIAMQPYDACRLIAVNLFSFVKNPFTDKAEFDFTKFYEINYEAMRLSDDLIDLELKQIEKIITKIHNDPESDDVKKTELDLWYNVYETAKASRRTGLGFTALGDALAALGLKYDSDEALTILNQIMHTKMESELDCTIDLSILRGSFKGWDSDKEFPKANNIPDVDLKKMNPFYQMIYQEYPLQYKRMYKYGRRNVSWSTVAPTGTVSLMAQTTSGIEPLFMPFYMRRKKVNPNDEGVRIDFTDQNGDNWMEYPVLHPKFEDWLKQYRVSENVKNYTQEILQKYFKKSPWYKSTANDIDWIKRVEIQSIIQKYITHSISSTINLPSDVSLESVSDIYLESWKKGAKGITVYRDGSRSGVLVSTTDKDKPTFEQHDAPKRPKVMNCEVHQSTSQGVSYLVIVGLLDDKPYEVFCTKNIFSLPSGVIAGTLTKVKKGKYDLVMPDVLDIGDITGQMSDEQEAITRLASISLRHGAEIKFVVEQLQKTPGDMFSFSKSVARVLKKYIPDGSKATVTCQDCGSDNVIFEEGCHKCLDCGSSKCG